MAEVKAPLAEHLLETLFAIVEEESRRVLGIEGVGADLLAEEVARRFCASFGGLQIYLPKGRSFHAARSHRQIYEAFTGSNQMDLALRFGCSVQHIYRVVARERERDRLERQQTIPGLPS